MAANWLPHYDNWQKGLAANKLKDDAGVTTVLKAFWKLRSDECDTRLSLLPRLLKAASDFKKSKPVVAAGTGALKMANELLDVLPAVRKQVEQQKRDFAASGAHPIDVQFVVVDWNGATFEYAERAFVTFESPGVPKVTESAKVTATGVSLNDIRLRSSGAVSLMIVPAAGHTIEGATDYEFKPGKPVMKFKAVQHSKRQKIRAKSIDEVKDKLGYKVSAGLELFKVVKIGGEAAKESEFRQAWEDEVEWEVEVGLPTFKDFKQI